MVSFIVILVGPSGTQIKHYYWMYLWECFWWDKLLNWWLKRQMTLPSVWASFNPLRAWTEKKAEDGGILPFCFWPDCLNWDICFLLSVGWDLHHWLFCLRPSDVGRNYTVAFLGLQLTDGRLAGLLGLQGPVNQFLIINLFIHFSNRVSVFGETWLIQRTVPKD